MPHSSPPTSTARGEGANLENGLLHVDLVREIPDAMKPRTIAINNGKAKAAVTQLNQVAA